MKAVVHRELRSAGSIALYDRRRLGVMLPQLPCAHHRNAGHADQTDDPTNSQVREATLALYPVPVILARQSYRYKRRNRACLVRANEVALVTGPRTEVSIGILVRAQGSVGRGASELLLTVWTGNDVSSGAGEPPRPTTRPHSVHTR